MNARPNKFPGVCKCGASVAAMSGTLSRQRGKWVVACASCCAPTVPQRDMIGTIHWPNGMGYTECSEEYELAVNAERDAQEALREDPENSALYEAFHRAASAVLCLQAEGGHMGERIQFDKPDVMTALLGGGSIAVRPGGSVEIVERRP